MTTESDARAKPFFEVADFGAHVQEAHRSAIPLS
jgi:hypothetical protein